jgi:hypothetical protein
MTSAEVLNDESTVITNGIKRKSVMMMYRM